MKETKQGLASPEARAAMHELMGAFESFKAANDERLEAIERKGERGLSMLARAAPAGGPPGGPASREQDLIWRGLSRRPWSPAHLRAEVQGDGAIHFSWIRRARSGGDGWDLEPALGEEREIYRVEALADGVVVAAYETETTTFEWTAAEQAIVLAGLTPATRGARVAQGSAIWGWGTASTVAL